MAKCAIRGAFPTKTVERKTGLRLWHSPRGQMIFSDTKSFPVQTVAKLTHSLLRTSNFALAIFAQRLEKVKLAGFEEQTIMDEVPAKVAALFKQPKAWT